MHKTKAFSNLIFDLTDKTFTICEGSVGVYDYTQIIKCSAVYEDAKYTDKSEMFSHEVLVYTPLFARRTTTRYDKPVCTGVKFIMKNGDVLYVYLSKQKLSQTSVQFEKEQKEAECIVAFGKKMIEKYKENAS